VRIIGVDISIIVPLDLSLIIFAYRNFSIYWTDLKALIISLFIDAMMDGGFFA
jgi:hypothetical protein